MKNVVCNLCGSDDWDVRYPSTMALHSDDAPEVSAFRCTSAGYGDHAQIVQCKKCSYVYANPVWDESDLIHLYSEVQDETYVTERIGRQLTFAKHLKEFEQITGKRQRPDLARCGGLYRRVCRCGSPSGLGCDRRGAV